LKRGYIRSVFARLNPEHRPSVEKGQALPIVLAALALGVMVVAPFLYHASSSLVSARSYREMVGDQYSADAGGEEAIWRLEEDGLSKEIPEVDDKTTYNLEGKINGLSPTVTVTHLKEQDSFRIESLAGSTTITAEVILDSGSLKINSWQIKN
jgi:hypothetical protein